MASRMSYGWKDKQYWELLEAVEWISARHGLVSGPYPECRLISALSAGEIVASGSAMVAISIVLDREKIDPSLWALSRVNIARSEICLPGKRWKKYGAVTVAAEVVKRRWPLVRKSAHCQRLVDDMWGGLTAKVMAHIGLRS